MPLFPTRPRHRLLAVATGTLGLLASAAACAPEPTPDPEPTGFTSEKEALEAARETFEGYVEATNKLDFSKPETAEPVYSWLVDDALDSERDSITTAHAEEHRRSGAARITMIDLAEADLRVSSVSLNACLDVSGVEVLDKQGTSLVSSDRVPVQSLLVALVASNTTETKLAIQSVAGREGEPECDSP